MCTSWRGPSSFLCTLESSIYQKYLTFITLWSQSRVLPAIGNCKLFFRWTFVGMNCFKVAGLRGLLGGSQFLLAPSIILGEKDPALLWIWRWEIGLGRRNKPHIDSTKSVKPTVNSNCEQLTLQKDRRQEVQVAWHFPDNVQLAIFQKPGHSDQMLALVWASRMTLPSKPSVKLDGEWKSGPLWLFSTWDSTQYLVAAWCCLLTYPRAEGGGFKH